MLTKTGAKLMDFGLAKASVASASAASGLSAILAAPQGSHPLTTQGSVAKSAEQPTEKHTGATESWQAS